MRHCFVNSRAIQPAAWREAMPGADVLAHDELHRLAQRPRDIIWHRLSAGSEPQAAIAAIRERSPAPVVILSDAPNDDEAARALAAGASGYCNTHAAPEVLKQVALVVANGGLWLGQALLQRLMTGTAKQLARRKTSASTAWADRLSEREREVAAAVADGASNKEIAARLGIGERTVKAHLSAIFEKLDVRDRLQLSLRVNGAGTA